MLAAQTKNPQKDLNNSSSCCDNLQQYSNYLTRHSDVNIVCRQPVCHYAVPLLGGIKRNASN